jgi:gamma-glutamylcyclotransferase (GGCT)/AIG2-like uncharacterized protein YtfP
VIERWRWLGEACVAGRLYDLGDYPGVVLDAAGEERVFGELAELPGDAALWARLDRYEGFDPQRPETSLFRRVRCRAEGSEHAGEAWIYVCGREPGPERLLPGGRWRPRDTLGRADGRRR